MSFLLLILRMFKEIPGYNMQVPFFGILMVLPNDAVTQLIKAMALLDVTIF